VSWEHRKTIVAAGEPPLRPVGQAPVAEHEKWSIRSGLIMDTPGIAYHAGVWQAMYKQAMYKKTRDPEGP